MKKNRNYEKFKSQMSKLLGTLIIQLAKIVGVLLFLVYLKYK